MENSPPPSPASDVTLFEAFYKTCLDLGVCQDVASWAVLFDVLPSNARRYAAGTLRPRPERVQIWCERLRLAHGFCIHIELPPHIDEARLVVEHLGDEQGTIVCGQRVKTVGGQRVTTVCRLRDDEG